MNYSLAKELRDVGFSHNWCSEDDCSCLVNGDSTKGTACFPTLEELIDACGDNLESVIQRGNGDGDNWEVRSKVSRFNATSLVEAVAQLWLAFHKKL